MLVHDKLRKQQCGETVTLEYLEWSANGFLVKSAISLTNPLPCLFEILIVEFISDDEQRFYFHYAMKTENVTNLAQILP